MIDTEAPQTGKTSLWALMFSPFVGLLYYLSFESAFLHSINYVIRGPEGLKLVYSSWSPDLTWGSHWFYRLFAEGVSIVGATYIAAGLAGLRAKMGGLLGGLGIAALAAMGTFVIFVLGGEAATIEPWYQNVITALMVVAAPVIGWVFGEVALEQGVGTEKGFAGIPRGHFAWLWIIFWFYGLALVSPVLNLWQYYQEDPMSLLTAIGGIIRMIPIVIYLAPLVIGLGLLAGIYLRSWPSALRQVVGFITLVGGFALVAAAHTAIAKALL